LVEQNAHYAERAIDELGLSGRAEELFPLVYEELRILAHSWLSGTSRSSTLQPTAIVHEAYLRLVSSPTVKWSDCAHFRAIAARAMRQILIDSARRARAGKRGGHHGRVTLSDAFIHPASAKNVDMLDLDAALEQLASLNERHAAIVELRFFGGLSVHEVAKLLGISKRSVELDWKMARSWLFSTLDAPGEPI